MSSPLRLNRPFTPGRALALAVHLALAGVPMLAVAPASAQEQSKLYAIPAGSLSEVLSRYAREAGVEISFDASLLAKRSSPGLHGSYSVDAGFAALLHSQGLRAQPSSDGFTVAPAATDGSVELGATDINSSLSGETTEGTHSYTTAGVTIGKSTQSLRETPQSVTVMTRQLMDDRNLTTLEKVMSQTPGITFGQRNFGAHVYQSRGFVLGEEAYLMDGVPGQAYTVIGWLPPDMAIYDRVEVLRGASGLLVGAGDPGGAVNLVRKRPTEQPKFSITTRAGSWDNYRIDLDGSGKLNDEGTIRGRMVAAYEDADSYLDVKHSTTPLLYGIVEADLNDSTTLTASLRRQTGKVKGYSIFGLPRYSDGGDLHLSRSTALVQDWNSHETEMTEGFAELSHRFNDDWVSKTAITHSVGGFEQALTYARGAINPATNTGSTFRAISFRRLDVTSTGLDTHVEGNFDAFGLSHQVMIGANSSRQEVRDKMADTYFSIPVDVFDVDHHAFGKPARPAWTSITNLIDERSGVYANTRLHLSEPLSLVLGTRVSWYNYDFDYKMDGDDYVAKQDREVTPFAGLIYDIDEYWSWYASYADIFQPQSNYRDVSGSPLDPAVGANYETGIKGELFDKRLNLSFALFYVKQKDVMVEDTENFDCNNSFGVCYAAATVLRSKGFDLEASGEMFPGLQVLAGYTFNLTRSSAGGAVSSETPKHLARVTTSYELPGEWSRLTIGGGVSAQSGYLSSDTQEMKYGAAGRAIWNARAAWKVDEHWQLALNADNLFDRKYYIAADGVQRNNIYSDPRSYTLTLRGDF